MLLKFEAEAKSLILRPEVPRPKFWPGDQFDLEALTSLVATVSIAD